MTNLEKTALLTLFCRHLESKKNNRLFADDFADWFFYQHTAEIKFDSEIRKDVVRGVPIRTAMFDEIICKFAKQGQKVNVVTIGAGFDTRWERLKLDNVIFHEVDSEGLLEEKQKIISVSPFKDNYSRVQKVFFDLTQGFPREFIIDPKSLSIFVAEGIFMYFSEKEIRQLLDSIRCLFDNPIVIFDTYDKKTCKHTNRTNTRSTGSKDIYFNWAPPSIKKYYQNLEGWEILEEQSIINKMLHVHKSFMSLFRSFSFIKNSYKIVVLRKK